MQVQRAMDLLLAGTAEQDQRQLGRGHGVGAGVMTLADLQPEVVDPVVQPGLAKMRLGAE